MASTGRTTSARERVLVATRECLVERGHAGTTTSEIARRAGLAEGTIYRHFGTKAALLCATAGWVLADVRTEAAARLRGAADRWNPAAVETVLDHALAVVWSQYARADLLAVHELFLAARTDHDLASMLDELNGPHRDELHALAADVLPGPLVERGDFPAIVDFVIDGVAMVATSALSRGGGGHVARLAMLRAAVHALFDRSVVHPAQGRTIDALARSQHPAPEEVPA